MPVQAAVIQPTFFVEQTKSINPKITQAATLLIQGKRSKAKKIFQQVLSQTPNDTAAILGLADVAYLNKDNNKVKELLFRALEIAPKNAAVHTSLGRFHYIMQKKDAALVHFKKAIELDPQLAAPEIEIASLYLSGYKNPTAAAKHYQRAIELDKNNINIRYAYASILSMIGTLTEAMFQIDTAIKIKSENPYAYQLKAIIYTKYEKYNLALNAIDKAIRLDSKNIQPYWIKAEILYTLDEQKLAFKVYNKILKISPNHALTLTKLGHLHQIKGDFNRAEKLYKRAIKHDPTTALAYNNLAFGVHADKERKKEAITWAKKAVALQPNNPEFMDTLALVYLSNNEVEKTQRLLESLIKKFPSFLDGVYKLARIYDDKGNRDSAVYLYKSILQKSQNNYKHSKEIEKRLIQLEK